MTTISGILRDGQGKPIRGSLILCTKRTTDDVIVGSYLSTDTVNGRYSFNLKPCEYDAFLIRDSHPAQHLGTLTIYSDSPDGTLNEYLIAPPAGDVTPAILKQVLAARDEAQRAARAAIDGGSAALNQLSNADGSALIGHYGSNVQTIIDSAGRLHYWLYLMASGQLVKIVCFGDSTTDGNTTKGWVRNVAGTDHNKNAPSAWPAQTQAILRDMFGNNNIYVFNAGASGQRIDNGWAVDNFEKWVTDNPHYGVPNIVIIGFGINDAGHSTGDLLGDTLKNTNLLIDKITKLGALPVLLTSNVTRATGSDSGANKLQLLNRINGIKRRIARDRNIPLFDLELAVKNWMSTNPDGYNYTDLQSDLTHWGDVGHRYQACWIAGLLYDRLLKIDENSTYVSAHYLDSRANSDVGNKNISISANTKFGFNGYIASKNNFDCENRAIQDIWVWNEHVNASIIYRCNLSDANNSTIKITDMLTGSNYTQTAGFSGRKFDNYSAVDMPFYVGQLKYGLNRIQLIGDSEQSSALVLGHFDFIANYQGKRGCKNLLQNTGTFRDYQTLTAAAKTSATNVSLAFSPDVYDPYGANVIQLFNRDKIAHICVEGRFSAHTGLFLVQANGRRKSEIVGIMLYGFPNSVTVYKHRYNKSTGEINFEAVGKSVPVRADTAGVFRLGIKSYFNKNGRETIEIYNEGKLAGTISWDGIDNLPPQSGVIGNVHRYMPAGKSGVMMAEINKLEVFYTDLDYLDNVQFS